MDNNIQYRHELKHILLETDVPVIASRLSHVMRLDQNAGPDGCYHIRSLYFDTPEDKALFDKFNGTPLREKFRFRIYNHDHSFIRLEKKIKLYGHGAKMSTALTRDEAIRILKKDTAFLRKSEQALQRDFYIKLKTERLAPKVVVDYTRLAYFCAAGRVRVTIDRNIRASIGSTDLFNAFLPTAPALERGQCILEVKYDGFLPEYIQDIIQSNKCATAAVSKYAACRAFM